MLNKSIILGIVSLLPISFNTGDIVNTNTSLNSSIEAKQEDIQAEEECSVMYVGKSVSETGNAIIARSSDAGPTGMNLNAQIFVHNELANKFVEGKNGFRWKMPNTTYRYISTPRNPAVNKGLHWEASGINENGVGISGVLTCYSNADTALVADPLVSTGISEDNIAQILSATATSARQAMDYLAQIIDEEGSAEQNIILSIDQNEAWCMETYTGHQYIAIKLPDDKACTIGNEFMFDSLASMFEKKEIDWDNDVIYSEGLFTLPEKATTPFAVYDEGHETTKEPQHLNLFKTYARPLDLPDQPHETDYSHRRTWRGVNLFTSHQNETDPGHQYETTRKDPAFFHPNRKLGIEDVKTFMRDRFEDILANPDDPNHDEFQADLEAGELRYIGIETAYQIHIITVHPELPKEIAVEEWLCISNSNYAPFVPISNGINRMNSFYTHISDSYGYDSQSIYCIYKSLNTLAAFDREKYGMAVQNFWEFLENNVWMIHWNQLLEQAKDLPLAKAKQAITNFDLNLQEEAINKAIETFEDLTWHIINDYTSFEPKEHTYFDPFVDLQTMAKKFGWAYEYNDETKIAKLSHEGQNNVWIDYNYKWNVKGKISTLPDIAWQDCVVEIRDGRTRLNWIDARNYLGGQIAELVPININDYFDKPSNLTWVIPTAIFVPILIAAAILTPIIIVNRRKLKAWSKRK